MSHAIVASSTIYSGQNLAKICSIAVMKADRLHERQRLDCALFLLHCRQPKLRFLRERFFHIALEVEAAAQKLDEHAEEDKPNYCQRLSPPHNRPSPRRAREHAQPPGDHCDQRCEHADAKKRKNHGDRHDKTCAHSAAQTTDAGACWPGADECRGPRVPSPRGLSPRERRWCAIADQGLLLSYRSDTFTKPVLSRLFFSEASRSQTEARIYLRAESVL